MKVNVYQQKRDAAVVVLEGELDALSAPIVRAELEGVIAEGAGDVAIDMGAVTFMDSSGAGALVFLHKRLVSQSRTLELVGVVGQPLDLLTLLRISNAIPVNQRPVARPPLHRRDDAGEGGA